MIQFDKIKKVIVEERLFYVMLLHCKLNFTFVSVTNHKLFLI